MGFHRKRQSLGIQVWEFALVDGAIFRKPLALG